MAMADPHCAVCRAPLPEAEPRLRRVDGRYVCKSKCVDAKDWRALALVAEHSPVGERPPHCPDCGLEAPWGDPRWLRWCRR